MSKYIELDEAISIINNGGQAGNGADLINRADAIEAVHKYFVDAFNNEPHEIDEDGDDVFTDMKSVNALLHHNKMVSKALKALPSADAVQGEWVCKEREYNDCDGYYAHYWYECSVCGARPPKDQWRNEWHSNYCPSCGSRMYKGGDDE